MRERETEREREGEREREREDVLWSSGTEDREGEELNIRLHLPGIVIKEDH